MYKYIFLLLTFVCYTNAQQCGDCSGIFCAQVACNEGTREVYIQCACCPSCVPAIGENQGPCNVAVEPQPGGPVGPDGSPRVVGPFPICDYGLRCNPFTLRCQKAPSK